METVPPVTLRDSGLEVSRIGLGLSHLHHLPFQRDRKRLIDCCLDIGVTHFDVAPLYGDGVAERSLGTALANRRDSVTIATKCGLLPNALLGALGTPCAWPFWATRSAARNLGILDWPKRSFSPASLRQSLDNSLRRLKTDYVDILFIHDPRPSEIEGNEKLIEALTAECSAGRVRFVGLAGTDTGSILSSSQFQSTFDVTQTHESRWDSALFIPDFTYGVMGALDSDSQQKGESSQSTKAKIQSALSRRSQGAILVGTSKLDHLMAAAQAAIDVPSL